MSAPDLRIILRVGGGADALDVEVVGECSAELLNALRRAKPGLLDRLRRHFPHGATYTPIMSTGTVCFQCVHFDPSATDPATGWGVCMTNTPKHGRAMQRPDDATPCPLFLGGKLVALDAEHDREALHLLREVPEWSDRLAELESAFLERWETGGVPRQEAEAVFEHWRSGLAAIGDDDHNDIGDGTDDLADSAVSILRSAETIESLAARWGGLRRYLRRELPASAVDELEKLFREMEAKLPNPTTTASAVPKQSTMKESQI